MSSTIAFTEALVATGIGDRDNTYWAGRATLVRRPEDHETYDRAFKVFWEGRQSSGDTAPAEEPVHITLAVDDDTGDDAPDEPDTADASDEETIELRFSATEVLRHKDFADYSDTGVDRGPATDDPPPPRRFAPRVAPPRRPARGVPPDPTCAARCGRR